MERETWDPTSEALTVHETRGFSKRIHKLSHSAASSLLFQSLSFPFALVFPHCFSSWLTTRKNDAAPNSGKTMYLTEECLISVPRHTNEDVPCTPAPVHLLACDNIPVASTTLADCTRTSHSDKRIIRSRQFLYFTTSYLLSRSPIYSPIFFDFKEDWYQDKQASNRCSMHLTTHRFCEALVVFPRNRSPPRQVTFSLALVLCLSLFFYLRAHIAQVNISAYEHFL